MPPRSPPAKTAHHEECWTLMRIGWRPSQMLDVEYVLTPHSDEDRDLYRNRETDAERPWYLVKEGGELDAPPWPPDAVVVVCVEAVREKPLSRWRDQTYRAFEVERDDVSDIRQGLIDQSPVRHLLRDRARAFEARLRPPPTTP